jgi:NAD(P)-dependent dehydrogenase (short-subunit alcohol dehydrogenase family)
MTHASVPSDPIATLAPGTFVDRVAVVTGGGRGIGRETALGFARTGADVVIAARGAEGLERTCHDIESMGRRCLAKVTDIRDVGSVQSLVDDTWEAFGALNFLICNAGGQFPARPSQISDGGWRAVVDLNLNGTWNVISRAVPRMIETGYGAIVTMVHPQAFDRGAPTFAHSGAARAGVVNLTRTVALYLAAHDITANVISPGAISTEGFFEEELGQMPGDEADILAGIVADTPAHRTATPEEVAACMLFLCSPAARFVTGQALVQDGGLILGNWNTSLPPDLEW